VSGVVISYRPIGTVRSPFSRLEGMPLQSVAAAADRMGWLEKASERVHDVRAVARFEDD